MGGILNLYKDRTSLISGVWAAPGVRETLPRGGGLRAPPFGRVSGAPGGRPDPQNERLPILVQIQNSSHESYLGGAPNMPGQGPFEFPAWPPEFPPGSRIRLPLRSRKHKTEITIVVPWCSCHGAMLGHRFRQFAMPSGSTPTPEVLRILF